MIGMSYTEDRSDNVSASATGTGGNKILSGDADNFKYLDYVNSSFNYNQKASETFRVFQPVSPTLVVCSIHSTTVIACNSNYRADAFDTSKLPIDKRWGKFPSLAVGWTISNENSLKKISAAILSPS